MRRGTWILVSLSGFACALSLFVSGVAEIFCLSLAFVMMAAALSLGVKLKYSFNSLLVYAALLFAAGAGLASRTGCPRLMEFLGFITCLIATILLFKFVVYMNRLCRPRIDENLDKED